MQVGVSFSLSLFSLSKDQLQFGDNLWGRSFGIILVRIGDLRSLGSWSIKIILLRYFIQDSFILQPLFHLPLLSKKN